MKASQSQDRVLGVPIELTFNADLPEPVVRVVMDNGVVLICPDTDPMWSLYCGMLGASMAMQQGVSVRYESGPGGNTITAIDPP